MRAGGRRSRPGAGPPKLPRCLSPSLSTQIAGGPCSQTAHTGAPRKWRATRGGAGAQGRRGGIHAAAMTAHDRAPPKGARPYKYRRKEGATKAGGASSIDAPGCRFVQRGPVAPPSGHRAFSGCASACCAPPAGASRARPESASRPARPFRRARAPAGSLSGQGGHLGARPGPTNITRPGRATPMRGAFPRITSRPILFPPLRPRVSRPSKAAPLPPSGAGRRPNTRPPRWLGVSREMPTRFLTAIETKGARVAFANQGKGSRKS